MSCNFPWMACNYSLFSHISSVWMCCVDCVCVWVFKCGRQPLQCVIKHLYKMTNVWIWRNSSVFCLSLSLKFHCVLAATTSHFMQKNVFSSRTHKIISIHQPIITNHRRNVATWNLTQNLSFSLFLFILVLFLSLVSPARELMTINRETYQIGTSSHTLQPKLKTKAI